MSQRPQGIFGHPVALLSGSAGVAALLWLLFVGSSNPHELAVGLVAVSLTTAFCALVFHCASIPFQVSLSDLAEAWRIPGSIAQDCLALLRVLARDLAGKPLSSGFRTGPFTASRHDPQRIGRAVLAVTYVTMTPNSIVIGVDPGRSLLLYHQLLITPPPTLLHRLGRPR